MDPETLKMVSDAAGGVKALIEFLKAVGVSSPQLDAADAALAEVQQALAGGTIRPQALVQAELAALDALKSSVSDPKARAVIAFIAKTLGKLPLAA